MLNYSRAQMMYRGRKDEHIGLKIRSRVYMTYDPTRNCFVLSELMTKYEAVPNPTAVRGATYEKAPKERWKMRPFAEIHTDHVLVTELMSSQTLEKLFGLSHYANQSKKKNCLVVGGSMPAYTAMRRLLAICQSQSKTTRSLISRRRKSASRTQRSGMK